MWHRSAHLGVCINSVETHRVDTHLFRSHFGSRRWDGGAAFCAGGLALPRLYLLGAQRGGSTHLAYELRLVALRSLKAEYEKVLFLAFRSLGGPLTSSHGIGFLVDYHVNDRMSHVRGNFDLKTMTARVGSGPSVTVSRP